MKRTEIKRTARLRHAGRPSTQGVRNARAAEGVALVAAALATAADRGWLCCGDLVSAATRRRNAFKHLPDEQRFALSVVKAADSECWLWAGSLKNNGYGQFRFRGRNSHAHRVSYEIYRGRIPDDLYLDHLCRTKACVNPSHLEAVTAAENSRRYGATITECPKGHAYDEANTMRKGGGKGGRKGCRACHNDRTNAVSARRYVAERAARGTAAIKLSDEDVRAMKRLRQAGMSVIQIAADFGVTAKYASAVIAGSRSRRRSHTGPGAQVLRLLAVRSGGQCEFEECAVEAAHTHHRRPRRIGSTRRVETNLPSNLVRLCSAHHDWVEAHRRLAIAQGLLLHDRAIPAAVPCRVRYGPVLLDNEGGWRTPDQCPGCVCDPVLCSNDASGGHCEDQSCGSCLHGCPVEGGCPVCVARYAEVPS